MNYIRTLDNWADECDNVLKSKTLKLDLVDRALFEIYISWGKNKDTKILLSQAHFDFQVAALTPFIDTQPEIVTDNVTTLEICGHTIWIIINSF